MWPVRPGNKKTFGKEYSSLEPYKKLSEAILSWKKNDNWKIANNEDWNELEDTDLKNF